MPPNGEIFVPKPSRPTSQYLIVFNFNYPALVLEILCPKFRLGGPVLPCTPPRGKIFVPEASTLLCLMAFLVSTF